MALQFAIIAFNNVTDYGSNFAFVQHVLSMDSTFPGNKLMWRAFTAPWIHHAFYAGIIATETLAAVLLGYGALKLGQGRNAPVAEFQKLKAPAIAGLTLVITLFLGGFLTIGGEWFVMWQSSIWNGQTAAARMMDASGIILIFLVMRDE
jgi:predicted small integral membrane protein